MKLSSAAQQALRDSRSRGGGIHGDATRAPGQDIAVKEVTITKKKNAAEGRAAKNKRRPGGKVTKAKVVRQQMRSRVRTAPKSMQAKTRPVSSAPSKAPRPLRGNANPGSAKEALMKEGAGQKMLKTWRSMNVPTRVQATEHGKAAGKSLKEVIQGVRANRSARNVNPTTNKMGMNRRVAAGISAPKTPKLPMGLTPNIKPRKKSS